MSFASTVTRINEDGVDWVQLASDQFDAKYAKELLAARDKAIALGLDKWLWEFQLRDVCRASLKQNVLLAYLMGLGKSRTSLGIAIMYGSAHTLIVAPKRLWGEWVEEIRNLGLLDKFQIVETIHDARHLKKFNLVSLTDLWRIPEDSPNRYRGQANYRIREVGDKEVKTMGFKYSLAWHLRKCCGTVLVDEAYSLKDVETNQTRAIMNIRARHKVLLTGTPVRGYPHNILSLLNWAFGNGSDVWPEYSFYVEGAVQKFLDRFGSYIYYDEQHSKTASKGKKKLLPKIKDPEGFQRMLAPFMIRRLNTEPEVREWVKIPVPDLCYEPIDMDSNHRKLYEKVLEDFQAWYEEAEEKARKLGKEVNQRDLLAKLQALIGCASFPQRRGEAWVTAKQQRALDLIDRYIVEGRKVIVLSHSVDGAKWMLKKAMERNYSPVYIDGSVSLAWDKKKWTSKRIQALSQARRDPSIRMIVGTTPCLAEGLNLPEFSAVIFLDYNWVPSVMAQAFSRVLRPQQKWDVFVHFLTCKGTIEEYMELLCQCKSKSIAEGLDYEDYDFSLEDLPDIRAYAQALVENRDILSRLSRVRKMVVDEEPAEEAIPF